jgi:GT2 family glycosyltransferase
LTYEKNWASKIIEVIDAHPRFLSASPWCPQTQGDNKPHGNSLFAGYRVRGEIAGWCIFQKRSIYDRIGDLDENFTHWYCDNDYGMTLQSMGIVHSLIADSVVNHHDKMLGKTHEIFDNDYQVNTTVMQRTKFEKKWVK